MCAGDPEHTDYLSALNRLETPRFIKETMFLDREVRCYDDGAKGLRNRMLRSPLYRGLLDRPEVAPAIERLKDVKRSIVRKRG